MKNFSDMRLIYFRCKPRQTHYERELEKADKLLSKFSGLKNRNSKGKKIQSFPDTPEGRAQRDLAKAEEFRHRMAKKAKKGVRARAGNLVFFHLRIKIF